MSQKPNFYEVLGVDKKASVDDIKAAFKKIAMKCHPDMLRGKTDAEKAAAGEKFQLAKEANEALTDPIKRTTYDKYGHEGLANLKGMDTTSVGDPHNRPVRRPMPTADDTVSFFDNLGEKDRASASTFPTGETAEQRRAAAAEQRRKDREAARQGTTPHSATPAVTDAFKDVAAKVSDAAERLKEAVLPLDVLQRFRDNLQDFLKEVDAAIERSRKNSGPSGKP